MPTTGAKNDTPACLPACPTREARTSATQAWAALLVWGSAQPQCGPRGAATKSGEPAAGQELQSVFVALRGLRRRLRAAREGGERCRVRGLCMDAAAAAAALLPPVQQGMDLQLPLPRALRPSSPPLLLLSPTESSRRAPGCGGSTLLLEPALLGRVSSWICCCGVVGCSRVCLRTEADEAFWVNVVS